MALGHSLLLTVQRRPLGLGSQTLSQISALCVIIVFKIGETVCALNIYLQLYLFIIIFEKEAPRKAS